MPEVVSIVKGPKEAYESMVDKGVELANKPLMKIFHQSFFAGCYIGFGGMMSMVVAGGLDEAAKDNPTIQTFVFAALFPVNLLIIILTGGVLFTGTCATVPAAVCEGKLHWKQIPRTFLISWFGNLLGGVACAAVITYCDMNEGLTAKLAMKIAEKKISHDFIKTLIKGIGCNWLVAMAVFLSGQAQDMAGKMVAIWFPISCFVAIGFEHFPANTFIIPMGMMVGADVSVQEMFYKNFIPVTLGNAFAGSFIVAMGYSYAFGRLAMNTASLLPVSRVSREDIPGQGMSRGASWGTSWGASWGGSWALDVIDQREKEQKARETSTSTSSTSAVYDAAQGP